MAARFAQSKTTTTLFEADEAWEFKRERSVPMVKTKRKNSRARAGCGYVFGLGILICTLLLVNSMIIERVIDANKSLELDKRITQTAQFLIPLLMIIFQFWIFDRFMGFFKRLDS